VFDQLLEIITVLHELSYYEEVRSCILQTFAVLSTSLWGMRVGGLKVNPPAEEPVPTFTEDLEMVEKVDSCMRADPLLVPADRTALVGCGSSSRSSGCVSAVSGTPRTSHKISVSLNFIIWQNFSI
jgi:hypothetical protein